MSKWKPNKGHFREVIVNEYNPDYLVKRPKSSKLLPVHLDKIIRQVRNYLAFQGRDLNEMELKVLKDIPPALARFIPDPGGTAVIRDEQGNSLMVVPRIYDFNGHPSKTVREYGPIQNEHFWREIDEMYHTMIQNQWLPSDVLFNGKNILVHKKSDNEWSPVIIDAKSVVPTLYELLQRRFITQVEITRFIKRAEQFFKKYNPNYNPVREKSE